MSDVPSSLVIRADATATIGAGHVMRCLGLARAWRRRHGPAAVWGDVSIPFVRRRLEESGVAVVVRPPSRARLLVVDSYDPRLRGALAEDDAFRVRALVDDDGRPVPPGYHAVWSPGPAAPDAYAGFAGQVIAGLDAVALAAPLPTWRPSPTGGRRAAVMLGGSRIGEALVAAVADAARRAHDWSFVGLGPWTPAGWGALDPDRPWEAAAACACVVTAAGSTLFEAAAVGIPVVAVQLADNQAANARWAQRAGAPTLDLTASDGEAVLATWLPDALTAARSLPPVHDGAQRVAEALASLRGSRATSGGRA